MERGYRIVMGALSVRQLAWCAYAMTTRLPLIVPRGAGEYPALYRGAPPAVEQDTSVIAAGSVRAPSAHWRQIILDWITERGEFGAPCGEAGLCLRDLRHQTCGPRVPGPG